MTERLYYTDQYLAAFDATVVERRDAGGRPAVVLDRTAFYPTSGGQPFDVGTLGAATVVDVVDGEDGQVLHVVEGTPPEGRVDARIDWARRFEHMQQHTGQHVLSAAFDRLFGVRTVSFHMGAAAATIDLAREVSPTEIERVEDAANAVVWEDRPVTIEFADASDATALGLRKESSRTGRLRIVRVQDFDVSACGGTHVARTGAIGVIAVSGWERFKGGSRVEFRCGIRALRSHRALRDIGAAAAKLISGAVADLPSGVERLQAETRDLKRRARDLSERLAVYDGAALAGRAEDIAGHRVVVETVEAVAAADGAELKSLAQAVTANSGVAAVLLTSSTPSSIVVARAADASLDCAAVLRALVARFGGKGGGRPELAQGGGLTGDAGAIAAAAREEIRRLSGA